MPLYTVSKTATALSTNIDAMTIVASATKPLRVYIVDIKGMGTASAANEVCLHRSTSGTTGGGAITPAPVNSGAGAASFAVYTSWSAQPTLGAVVWRFGVNANGGIDKFVAIPGAEIQVPVGGQVSIRSYSGTSSAAINLLVEEVDG